MNELTVLVGLSKIRLVRRMLLLGGIAALVVAVGAAAMQGGVRKVLVTSPVQTGERAALTVDVVPRARCSIALPTGSYASSSRAALVPKTGGRITWRWVVPVAARQGVVRARVSCGASGSLRTSLRIVSKPEPLSLAEARTRACARVPQRVQSKYATQLVPLLDRTLEQLRATYGAFECAWGSNYYPGGTPISYYLMSVAAGSTSCTYVVSAQVVWPVDSPLPGYAGPVTEKYLETCKSLRA